VDGQGRLPLTARISNFMFGPEINPTSASVGAIPTASRLPDARLTVAVIGGETPLGNHIVAGLANPAYAAAFHVVVLSGLVLHDPCNEQELSVSLIGAHTVIVVDSHLVWKDGEVQVAESGEDKNWSVLLAAAGKAGVKRILPSPFTFDIQLPAKLSNTFSWLQRSIEHRAQLATCGLDYTIISCGLLTEHLFSPACGVDVERGIVRSPATWNTEVTTTTLDDLSRLIPEILLAPSAKNKRVQLASATLTYSEIADILQEVTGKPVQRLVENESDLGDSVSAFALLHSTLHAGRSMFWSKGDSWNARHVPHIITTPIREWAFQHLTNRRVPGGPPHEPNLHPSALGFPPILPTGQPLVVPPGALQPGLEPKV
jgi:hypothetical protein